MTTVHASDIAGVVADLRARRVRVLDPERSRLPAAALGLIGDPVVVDCTDIYHSLVARDDPVYIYEDHPCIAPPFAEAAYCYRNEHGNVIVMHATTVLTSGGDELWVSENLPDWSAVRWVLDTYVWLGGRSAERGMFLTTGPVHAWRFAIGGAGQPLDLRWVQLVRDYPMEHWDMAHLVLLGALNFLNCTNVEVAEPARPRPERRRIARTGVRVHTLVVTGPGRTSRAVGAGGAVQPQPLTSVRGHFAHYGDCCPGQHEPRGLLFGALEGRFWRPQHARGDAAHGEDRHDYVLRPEEAS